MLGDKSKPDEYLLPGEQVVGEYKIGGFNVLTTNANTYFHKSFPMLLKRVPYRDVSNVEYVTNIEWVEFEKAIVLFNLVVLMYINHNGILLVGAFMKWLMPAVTDSTPVDIIVITLASLLFVAAMTAAAKFLISFKGRFVIAKKSGQQVVLYTSMNPDLRAFMKEVEIHIDENAIRGLTPPAPEPEKSKVTYFGAKRPPQDGNRLEEIAGKKTIIVSVDSTKHALLMIEMLDVIVNKRNIGGVYLAFTRPSDDIIATMHGATISDGDIQFIDCVSSMVGREQKKEMKNVIYIENPNSLEEISMHLDKCLSNVKSQTKFILLDSISSFMIYNSERSAKEFIHYFINKSKIDELMCIIVNIEGDEANRLIQGLIPLCDLKLEYK